MATDSSTMVHRLSLDRPPIATRGPPGSEEDCCIVGLLEGSGHVATWGSIRSLAGSEGPIP